jgi:hypothetical protein
VNVTSCNSAVPFVQAVTSPACNSEFFYGAEVGQPDASSLLRLSSEVKTTSADVTVTRVRAEDALSDARKHFCQSTAFGNPTPIIALMARCGPRCRADRS